MEFRGQGLPALYLFIHLTLGVGIFGDERHIRGVLRITEQVIELLQALLHLGDFLLAFLNGLLSTFLATLLLLALGVIHLCRR